jgi:hypothetical protein
VQPTNGFAGSVAVAIGNLPQGITVKPSSITISVNGASASRQVTITATEPAVTGTVGLVVTGTSGDLQASTNIQLDLHALSVTTWHYDNLRTGVNSEEPILNLSNVKSSTFGKLYTLPVDGAIVGGVLYLGNISLPGKGNHNVIYAATMHDSVYAFDADSNSGSDAAPLWKTTLLPPHATPMPIDLQKCQALTQWTEVGVVSTPVIDPSRGILYVVAKSYEDGAPVFRLHALNVASGAEMLGGPVEIAASSTLNGQTDTFSALAETNRPALLLTNGHLYLAFGSNGCNAYGAQGWVLSYDASTLAQEGVFNTEPGRGLASIWQKGAGLSSDGASNVYAETGEGNFTPGTNFGSSVLKLSQSNATLQLADWFTPYNQYYLSQNDLDLNDAVLLLPDQPGPHPHLAIAAGKEGTLYLLDRDSMGHFCSTCTSRNTQIVQEFPIGPSTGSLVYWNSTVYSSGNGSPIMAWSLKNGVLSKQPIAQTATVAGGHSPIITVNGTSDAILWQINGSELTAYNAITLAQLYKSSQAQGRDDLPPSPHFAQLMIANGKLYIGTNNSIAVYGLF